MQAKHSMQLQKEVKSNPKQPSSKKIFVCGPQEDHCEKRCKIQGGCQEMGKWQTGTNLCNTNSPNVY